MRRYKYDTSSSVSRPSIAPAPRKPFKEIPLQMWEGKYWHTPLEASEILSRNSIGTSVSSIYQSIRTVWIEDYHYKRFGPKKGRIGINIHRVIEG